jgi:hypothetical protein
MERKIMSNYQSHAVRELKKLGYLFDEDDYPIEDPTDDFDMNAEMCMCVLEVLEVFAKQGHSGMSASYAISILEKVMKFEPLSPLTGEDDEWNCINDERTGNNEVFQNKRSSNVFKEGGEAYDIDGKVFIDPDGASFTSFESRMPVTFPYTPKRIYMNVDSEGNEIGERDE